MIWHRHLIEARRAVIFTKTDIMVDSSIHLSTMIIFNHTVIHSVVIHASPLVTDQLRNAFVLEISSTNAINNREILVDAL